MKKLPILLGLSILGIMSLSFTSAHPGNTDAYGCHTCRTNCAKWGLYDGEYHCHNSKGVTQPLPQVTSSSKTNTTTYVYPSTSVLAKKVLTSAETTEVKNIITANTSSNSIQYVSVDKLVSLLDDHEVSKVVKEYQTVLAKMNKILKAKLAEINKIEEAREEAKDSATGMPCPSYLIDYGVNACNDYILHPEKYI